MYRIGGALVFAMMVGCACVWYAPPRIFGFWSTPTPQPVRCVLTESVD